MEPICGILPIIKDEGPVYRKVHIFVKFGKRTEAWREVSSGVFKERIGPDWPAVRASDRSGPSGKHRNPDSVAVPV